MTYKEKYQTSKSWQQKVQIVNLYYQFKSGHGRKWSMRNTATYFGISLGLVSEYVKLGLNMEKVKHFESRNKAMFHLTGKRRTNWVSEKK